MKPIIIASLSIGAALANAQSTSEWTFAGYVDVYYQYDLGRPDSGDNVNGRGFDIAHNRFRLAVAELDIAKPPTVKNPFGLTLQLYAGKNAELIHLAEPGGKDKYRYVRQAYVSYAPPNSKNAVQFDLGKFDTWIGYEGIDNRSQDQYSRSFNWTYSEPVYETGLRVTGKLSDKLNGSFYIVRGWSEVEDGNGSPSIGVALSYAASPKTTVTLQNHYGDEGSDRVNGAGSYGGIGFPNAGTAKVHLLDLIISHQLTEKTKIALNVDLGNANGSLNDGTWNGEVLYIKHQVSPEQAAAFRLERMEDKNGLRAGVPIQFYSITGNYDWTLHKNAVLRLELRRDFASQAFFNGDNGLQRNRTTLTLGAIVKF